MTMRLAFPDFLRAAIPNSAVDVAGQSDGWAAPLGVVTAPNGFGEEAWGAQLETVLSIPTKGAPIVCEIPRNRGAVTNVRRRLWCLQTKGALQRYRSPGSVCFAHFYVTDALVSRVVEGLEVSGFTPADLRDDLVMAEDDTLWRLLDTYVERATDDHFRASRMEMEARALLVVERLVGFHHLGRAARPHRGGLAQWQVKRTQEAMLANMEAQISLDSLAEIAGRSATHFSRAFKQSVGVPPFEWLHQRRIERAKELLANGNLPLAEIALAVGFAAQPQFTTAFGKATGMTPGRWRREQQG